MYIWVFSRSVGAGRATTRKMRGLTLSVMALIVPPFPAPSRPSKMMQTLRPLCTTHCWSLTSSTCRRASSRSYFFRFSLPWASGAFSVGSLIVFILQHGFCQAHGFGWLKLAPPAAKRHPAQLPGLFLPHVVDHAGGTLIPSRDRALGVDLSVDPHRVPITQDDAALRGYGSIPSIPCPRLDGAVGDRQGVGGVYPGALPAM